MGHQDGTNKMDTVAARIHVPVAAAERDLLTKLGALIVTPAPVRRPSANTPRQVGRKNRDIGPSSIWTLTAGYITLLAGPEARRRAHDYFIEGPLRYLDCRRFISRMNPNRCRSKANPIMRLYARTGRAGACQRPQIKEPRS
jgi:hypothetical protein